MRSLFFYFLKYIHYLSTLYQYDMLMKLGSIIIQVIN